MRDKQSHSSSLIDIFSSLPVSTKETLANIESPLLLAFASLVIAEELNAREWMSVEHIVAALEAAGVAVKRKQISLAFSRAGNKISKKIINDEIFYKIMTKGRNDILPLLDKGTLQVFCVEAGQPRTARKMLSDILGTISGEVCICDPYYGVHSLDTLEMIDKKCIVKFLTNKTNENQATFLRHLKDFKTEYPNTEIRVFGTSHIFHDRYIFCDDYLLILGHGIKDIGGRESFVIKIDASYAADLIGTMKNNFNDRWKLSVSL